MPKHSVRMLPGLLDQALGLLVQSLVARLPAIRLAEFSLQSLQRVGREARALAARITRRWKIPM